MNIRNRRSGASLILTGIVGVTFFWLTDQRYGLASRLSGNPSSIDQANQALAGTVIGITGSAIVFFIGLWLLTRKAT